MARARRHYQDAVHLRRLEVPQDLVPKLGNRPVDLHLDAETVGKEEVDATLLVETELPLVQESRPFQHLRDPSLEIVLRGVPKA